MTTTNSTEYGEAIAGESLRFEPGTHDSDLKRFRATIALASQLAADIVNLFKLPPGFRFAYGILNGSVSLGSTTIQIGKSGSTAKYKADAVFTTTDLPVLFGKNATVVADSELTAEETVILTFSTATAPASGKLVVDFYGTYDGQ